MRRLGSSVIVVAIAAGAFVASWAPPGAAAAVKVPPTSPRAVRPVAGDGSATVSWTKPASNNGSKINAYKVVPYLFESPAPVHVYFSNETTQMVPSLKNGKRYSFRVAAHTAGGWSRLSAESPTLTIGTPTPPSMPSAAAGNGQVRLVWLTPTKTNGAGIDAYRVTPHLGSTALPARAFSAATTSQVITGLTNGKAYTFEVAAHNARGWSAPSKTSGSIVVGSPSAALGVFAVTGEGQATVAWSAPAANNGSAIDSYRVTSFLGGLARNTHQFANALTSHVISGLTNGGAYSFRVQAHNPRGWGPLSGPSSALVVGAPGVPTGVTATPGSGQAAVSWTAPVANGKPIGAYRVFPIRGTVREAPRVFLSAATSRLLTGLSPGQVYRFKVEAHNVRGWSAASIASAPVTTT